MTTIPPNGWQRLERGEFDRLQLRLRWRRWLGNATTAALAVVTAAAVTLAYQAVALLAAPRFPTYTTSAGGSSVAPAAGAACGACATDNSAAPIDGSDPK
jgi:hypothetical protein